MSRLLPVAARARLRLRWLACTALLACALAPLPASAQATLRGNYWRDRNTRVVAPEASLTRELPTGTIVSAGYLLDAITSASAAAGVQADQPFTELRNQISLGLGQRIGDHLTLLGSYRYSTESDYWAHNGGLSAVVDLFQRNTTLSAGAYFGHADVAMRRSAVTYQHVGHLDTFYGLLSLSQVLSRRLLLDAVVELFVDGSPNDANTASSDPSFLSNPYRTVVVGGSPLQEHEPGRRVRSAGTLSLRHGTVFRDSALRRLVFLAKLRGYTDDWGVSSLAPELRTYLGVGPFELRVTGRYYTQTAASFYRGDPITGYAVYATGVSDTVSGESGAKNPFFTGDAKLSRFSSFFVEARLTLELSFLARTPLPLHQWLGGGLLSVSYGHYVNDRYAWRQYGNAEVAGLELVLPL